MANNKKKISDEDQILENKLAFVGDNVNVLYEVDKAKELDGIIEVVKNCIKDLLAAKDERVLSFIAPLYERKNVLHKVDFDKAIKVRKELVDNDVDVAFNYIVIADDYENKGDMVACIKSLEESMKHTKTFCAAWRYLDVYSKLVKKSKKNKDNKVSSIINDSNKVLNAYHILTDAGFDIISHKDTINENEMVCGGNLLHHLFWIKDFLYKECKDIKETLRCCNILLQLHEFYDTNTDGAKKEKEDTLKLKQKCEKELQLSVPEEIKVKILEGLLRHSKNTEDMDIISVDGRPDVCFDLSVKEVDINDKNYKYLIIKTYDIDGDKMSICIDEDKFVKIHENQVNLRIENSKTELTDSKIRSVFDILSGNTFKYSFGDDKFKIDADVIYEIKPKVLLFAKEIMNEIREQFELIIEGEVDRKEFLDKKFNKSIKMKMENCLTAMRDLGFYLEASSIQDLYNHLCNYKLLEPYDVEYEICVLEVIEDYLAEYGIK